MCNKSSFESTSIKDFKEKVEIMELEIEDVDGAPIPYMTIRNKTTKLIKLSKINAEVEDVPISSIKHVDFAVCNFVKLVQAKSGLFPHVNVIMCVQLIHS